MQNIVSSKSIITEQKHLKPSPEKFTNHASGEIICERFHAALAGYKRETTCRPLLLNGDAVTVLKELPDECIDFAMTSPPYPMFETVMEQLGKPIVFNICMLGAFVGLTDLIRPSSVERILETRLSPSIIDLNRKVLTLGLELAKG